MREGDFWQEQPYDPYSQGILGDPVAITIHHTYRPLGANPPDPEQDKEKVRNIQQYHVSKRWGDVGYHFLIGSDGTVYEGRPLGYTGTHAPPNYGNIGVNVIGDFHEAEYPSSLQLESLVRLISWLSDKFDINPTAEITLFRQSNLAVCGHRDWNQTSCPGDKLYVLLPTLRDRIRARILASSPPYDARIVATQFLPETLLAGRQYELALSVRNTGYAAWSHLNNLGLESAAPDIVSVPEPLLKADETINPLSNRPWQIGVLAPPAPGETRFAVRMSESGRPFGPELGWDAQVLDADAFISEWLVAGPFSARPENLEADSADADIAKDFFAGEPLDVLEIMDPASESAHGYAVTDEYRSGQRNYRGEDGERSRESGRYFRGEETFRLSLDKYSGGDVILRKLVDGGVRDQRADVYLDGRRLAFWQHRGRQRFRRWRETDLVIPGYRLAHKNSIELHLKSKGTVQWGCSSFRYSLLSSGEPLVSPRLGDEAVHGEWNRWKSYGGLVDLSSAFPDAESGAAYLAAYVKSPQTKWAELRTGYNGRIKAWVNSKLLLAGAGYKPSFPDTERASVLVKRGWNRLLVKVALEPGAKDLYVRLCDRDGNPLEGLKIRLDPMDSDRERPLIARAD